MTIGLAGGEHVEAIQALYKDLFACSAAYQPLYYQSAEAGEAFLIESMANEKSDILVALEEGAVLGFALVVEQETPPFGCIIPRRYVYLMDLAVDPGHRGKGIGTALIEATKEWGRMRELDFIELTVLEGNENARRLYEREGLVPVMHTMRQPL